MHLYYLQYIVPPTSNSLHRLTWDEQYKWTAMHYAAIHGHYKIVRMLIEAKADIEAKDDVSDTKHSNLHVLEHPKLVSVMRRVRIDAWSWVYLSRIVLHVPR